MVLDPAALPDPATLSDVPVRLVDPLAPGFAADVAVCPRGGRDRVRRARHRDRARRAPPSATPPWSRSTTPEAVEERRKAVARLRTTAVAETPGEGALASGIGMRTGDVVEIAGVATLPAARRRGLGAAVTAALARRALDDGADLVFLAAGSDDIARVYLRVGFRRVGTACIAEPAAVSRLTPAQAIGAGVGSGSRSASTVSRVAALPLRYARS